MYHFYIGTSEEGVGGVDPRTKSFRLNTLSFTDVSFRIGKLWTTRNSRRHETITEKLC